MAIQTPEIFIKNNKTPQWVTDVRQYSKLLNMHVNGIGVNDFLSQINGYENSKQYVLREKFATSNKFVFENLLRPVDKVFSASGGATLVETKTEASKKLLREKLSDVREGYSIRKFINKVQSNKYYTDPSGLMFFEWDKDSTYPTFKSINTIRNYEFNGRYINWVIFEPVKRKKEDGTELPGEYYRFVDADYDYMIHELEGEQYRVIEEETFINPWGYVPAITNSNIIDSTLQYYISPIDSVIELANHYLTTTSVKNIYEFLHGYPIFWAYVQPCKACNATGLYHGAKCPVCEGDGHTFKKDVSDVIKLRPPTSNDEPKLAPDVAGYVQPELQTLGELRTELDWLWGLMHFSMWGTARQDKADNETATAAFIDVQPVNDRLNQFSDAFEQTEKLMTDIIAEFYIKANYKYASVNYGRRFLVEPPDAIWNKYQSARTDGAPQITLDYLLMQYYQSEYKDDLERMTIVQKGIKIEPFIHKNDEQILGYPISTIDKLAKIYFNEWWVRLDERKIIMSDVDKLAIEFMTYIQTKEIKTENIQDKNNLNDKNNDGQEV